MKSLATALFLVLCSLVLVRPAAADPFARHAHPFSSASSAISVPAQWAGIWIVTDSSYTCAGVFQATNSDTDTLCAGTTFSTGDTAFTCSGSADANTFSIHCTGSGQVFTDCQYNVTVDSRGTRTNESYFSVATTMVTYSGTGPGCNLVPPSCTQVNTHGTRIAPAPAAYCATPATVESWGQLKAHYR